MQNTVLEMFVLSRLDKRPEAATPEFGSTWFYRNIMKLILSAGNIENIVNVK